MERTKLNKDGLVTAGFHNTYWTDTTQPQRFNTLDKNMETDVAIIGGGMAGISVAYNLGKSGRKVVLLEDGFIGSGETSRTSAHLVAALDDRYYNLIQIHGEEGARLAAKSHQQAIDFIEKTIKEEKIDCEFERVNGYLFLNPTDKADSLDRELVAARKCGLEITRLDSLPGIIGNNKACLEFANQGIFHPLKYIHGLCREIIRNGGKIYTETHAEEVEKNVISTSNSFTVKANHVVLATNSPINSGILLSLKQYAYRTYVMGFKVKKGAVPKALWWDTGDFQVNDNIPPYHYVRTVPFNDEYDIMLSGGEDHATGLADVDEFPEEERYKTLEIWTRTNFPVNEVVYKWSGQVMEPMDSLAFIGRHSSGDKNVYIITGDSGNGMTHATIAGTLISDIINGKENEFEKLYNPSRFKIFKAGRVFLKEVIQGTISYIKTNPGDTEVSKLNTLKKGDGTIVKIDKQKLGIYRDEHNRFHCVSAECTHLNCIVKWNKDEKSWDCPCHGSRFTYSGKVINGPASSDLDYYLAKENEIPFPEEK